MTRSALKPVLIAAAVALGLGTTAASAQFNPFGFIFGDPPPRPPSGVPGGRQQLPAPAQPVAPPPDYYPAPGGPYGGIQSQPLPPPPGASIAPDGRQQATGLPPGQRLPRDAALQPPSEPVPEPPAPRIPNNAALFSGLDKITGRIINFDVTIGETVQFGALQLTPRACYTRPATETSNTDAFVEVDEVTLQGEVRRLFTGWMFAASPGLHAVEHPIYDLWLTDCKGPAIAAVTPPAETPPAAATRPPPRPQPKQPARQPAQQQIAPVR